MRFRNGRRAASQSGTRCGERRSRAADRRAASSPAALFAVLLAAAVAALLLGAAPVAAQSAGAVVAGEWPAYGADAGGSKASPLAQIDRENVGGLRVAWTYRTGDVSDGSRYPQRSRFQATPILVWGTLYFRY